jgi:hypothetical protein
MTPVKLKVVISPGTCIELINGKQHRSYILAYLVSALAMECHHLFQILKGFPAIHKDMLSLRG